jgi:hypothetical protein
MIEGVIPDFGTLCRDSFLRLTGNSGGGGEDLSGLFLERLPAFPGSPSNFARQLTEAFPWSAAPRYLIRDRDRIKILA